MAVEGNNTAIVDEEISIEGIESLFDTPIEESRLESEELDELEESILPDTKKEENIPLGSTIEEEEETEEIPKEQKESEEKPAKKDEGNRIKELIELGVLEDTRIATSEDDEEGTLLSEHSDLSQEQIRHIIKLQTEKKKKEQEESYISKENLSDHHLQIIEIMRNGGDLREVFQDPNQARKRPFEGKDLSSVEAQREVAMTYYTTQKGHTPKEAQLLVQQKEKDFELDTFATDVVTAYNKAFDGYLEQVERKAIEKKEEEKRRLSERKKSLVEAYKKGGLKDKAYNPVIEAVTKQMPDGKLPIHNMLEEILEKPEENYEVLLHLLNKEAYNELYNMKSKKKSTEEVLRLFDALPKDKANQVRDSKKESMSEIEEELSKIKLI